MDVLHQKSNLRILDCAQCDLVTDDSIEAVAKHCIFLESLSLEKCRNVQGRTLPVLIEQCTRLRTLIMEGTQLKDEFVEKTNWDISGIIELNVLNCYPLSFYGLSAVLPKLKRLHYLKCAVTDEILHLVAVGFSLLEVFVLHRRYPVTVQLVSDLLFHCPRITCLDISSIPLAFAFFESFLPVLPRLRGLSFAGNELLGTEKIIRSLAKSSIELEVLCVNYFDSASNFEIERSFAFLFKKCKKLREVILNGFFVNSIVASLLSLACNVYARQDITISENKPFIVPRPRQSLDNKWGDCRKGLFLAKAKDWLECGNPKKMIYFMKEKN